MQLQWHRKEVPPMVTRPSDNTALGASTRWLGQAKCGWLLPEFFTIWPFFWKFLSNRPLAEIIPEMAPWLGARVTGAELGATVTGAEVLGTGKWRARGSAPEWMAPRHLHLTQHALLLRAFFLLFLLRLGCFFSPPHPTSQSPAT